MPEIIDLFLHLDKHLENVILQYGPAAHLFLFVILFLETGLVIMPFLPGDSLLFAAGLFTNQDNGFSLPVLLFLLPLAAVLGDSVNFHIGKYVGGAMVRKGWIKAHWIEKTRAFYEKHGPKTIVIGRFVPIVRTVAPFVAGMEIYPYQRYLPLCILGSYIWVWICVGAGYLLGGIPWVRTNFELIILGVVILSVVGIAVEVMRERRRGKAETVVVTETVTETVVESVTESVGEPVE